MHAARGAPPHFRRRRHGPRAPGRAGDAAHQEWPAERATIYAEERDGVLDLPRGRIRCACRRPNPGPDGLPVLWKRRARLEGDVLVDLCDACRNNLHGATMIEVTMQAERLRRRAGVPPESVAFEVFASVQGGAFVDPYGPHDSYRIHDGMLEVITGDRVRTYSPTAWLYVEAAIIPS